MLALSKSNILNEHEEFIKKIEKLIIEICNTVDLQIEREKVFSSILSQLNVSNKLAVDRLKKELMKSSVLDSNEIAKTYQRIENETKLASDFYENVAKEETLSNERYTMFKCFVSNLMQVFRLINNINNPEAVTACLSLNTHKKNMPLNVSVQNSEVEVVAHSSKTSKTNVSAKVSSSKIKHIC